MVMSSNLSSPRFSWAYFLASLMAASFQLPLLLLQKKTLSAKECFVKDTGHTLLAGCNTDLKRASDSFSFDGLHHIRMGVPQVAYGDTCYKVGIFFPVGVPKPCAFSFHQRNRDPPVVSLIFSSARAMIFFSFIVHAVFVYKTISVPMPLSVNTSSRIACFSLPSTMCAFFTHRAML